MIREKKEKKGKILKMTQSLETKQEGVSITNLDQGTDDKLLTSFLPEEE